ncbi:MAG: CHAP domain-containing protein, partial [Anaerolineae bacterium]|nr:CHAP domain-containing protein [Anaerolineae bacterium]
MRKYKIWWIGILAMSFFGVLGYALSVNAQATTQTLALSTPAPPEPTHVYFENTEWGYSLEYPESWQTQNSFTSTHDAPLYVIRNEVRFTSPSEESFIVIDVWEQETATSIQDWLADVERITTTLQSNANISGQDAFFVSRQPQCGDPLIFSVYMPFKNRVFKIKYISLDHQNDADIEVYKRFLHTFTVIGATPSPQTPIKLPDITPLAPLSCECPNTECSNCYYAARTDGCCGYPALSKNWQCSRDCITHEFKGNCVWWAAYTRQDIGNAIDPTHGGNWGTSAEAKGFPVDHTPKIGDIVVNPDNISNHVAYVVWVSPDSQDYKVSDMGWCHDCGDTPEEEKPHDLGADDEFIHCMGNPVIPSNDWSFTNCPFGWTPSKGFEVTFLSGAAWVFNPGNDPYLLSPIISVSASDYNAIKIDMISHVNDTAGRIYFTTAANSSWGEDKAVAFTLNNDGQPHEYTINMNGNSNWQGTITRIRIDPVGVGDSDGSNDDVTISRIRFANTVNVPPNPPILQSPANGSLHNSRSLTLSWQDGGDPDNQPRNYRDYNAEVWASGWSQTLDWTTSTSWQVTVPNDGVYSWRVRAGDGELPSAWSETRTFQIDASAPTQASNVRPNGWTGPYTGDTTPSFAWNAASDGGSG